MILLVSLGSQSNNTKFEQIVKQDKNIYGGMYPVYVDDGEEIHKPVSIVKEQARSTVHFLNMEILQSTPGVSQIKIYDNREDV